MANQTFPSCRFIQGSIYDLPYSELGDNFDIVISVEVIEHLFYPKELVRNAKKCLKPNGGLILTTPYQCNYGLSKITSEWVLSLDADYILTNDLIREITSLPIESDINSYSVRFKYCVFGKPLGGTLLPPRKVLYKREKAIYQDDGHAHKVVVQGESSQLSAYIHHDDRKSLSRWLWAQDRYMVIESKKPLETPEHELSIGEFPAIRGLASKIFLTLD